MLIKVAKELAHKNALRSQEVFGLNPEDWSYIQWLNALGGEVGELQNILKKIDRDGKSDRLEVMAATEIGDCFIYLDLLMASSQFSLFYAINDQVGFKGKREASIPYHGLKLSLAVADLSKSYLSASGQLTYLTFDLFIAPRVRDVVMALFDICDKLGCEPGRCIANSFNKKSKERNSSIFVTTYPDLL